MATGRGLEPVDQPTAVGRVAKRARGDRKDQVGSRFVDGAPKDAHPPHGFSAQIVRQMSVTGDGGRQMKHLASAKQPFHVALAVGFDDRKVERRAAEIENSDFHASTVG